jgi:hypothetical protein
MARLKKTNKYYFTVEGETEQWYLQWLEGRINAEPNAVFRVSFACPIQKNPLKYARSVPILQKTKIVHMTDYESGEPVHTTQFLTALERMKEVRKNARYGRKINYVLGYSNLTFDLWVILHMADCNGPFTYRHQYIDPINRAYEERFENMDQYKHEDNFKRLLRKLTLENVKDAISRAETIMRRCRENGYTPVEYKGFSYYRENPSLSIGEHIKVILSDCGLL